MANPFRRKLKKPGLSLDEVLAIIESRLKAEGGGRIARQAFCSLSNVLDPQGQGVMQDKLQAARLARALSDTPVDWPELLQDVIRAPRVPSTSTVETDAHESGGRGSP